MENGLIVEELIVGDGDEAQSIKKPPHAETCGG